MIRKTILALAALSAVALASTSASAGWHGGWHGKHWGHYGWGHGYGYGISLASPYLYDSGGCYVVRRVVNTAFGPKVRRVTVCN